MYERASRTVEAPFANTTLIRGQAILRTRKVVLLAGAAFAAGSLLGLVTLGAATVAAKAGGNTGNGAIGAVTLAAGTKIGVYTVRFTAPTVFTVEDPDGFVLTVAGATGAAFVDDIGFTATAGATAFVAGDGFDITVGAGTGKAKLSAAAATDGSQAPSLVLAYDVDATAADVEAIAYESGDFVQEKLVLGTGHTLASVREYLRRHNITFG